MDRGNIAAAI